MTPDSSPTARRPAEPTPERAKTRSAQRDQHEQGPTLVSHLDFAITSDPAQPVLRDASLVLRGPLIEAIGPAREIEARYAGSSFGRRVDGRRRGVTPGFVDTHVHLSEMLSRSLFPDAIDTRTWVFHWAKPFYAHVSPEDEAVSVRLGLAEMARCGTTCLLDVGAQNDPGITAKGIEEVGLRGIVGRHAADNKPAEVPAGWSPAMVSHHFFPDAPTALRALRESIEQWDGYAGGRVRCWANIEGKEPCSLELHVGARALAEELGVGSTYHLATSAEEAAISLRRYGLRPVERIAQHGGLGPNLVLAHAVALNEGEVELLARNEVGVAFCPSSSLKLGKGATSIGRYPEMLAAGVKVGLGTDGVSASGNLNLHRQVHLMAGMFKDSRRDATAGGAELALRLATIGGARVVGLADSIGSLEPGKAADFVLFDLDHPEWVPFFDPVQALVWSASPASIAATWASGRPVFENGRVTTLDEASLREEARTRASEIAARAGLDEGNGPLQTSLYDE